MTHVLATAWIVTLLVSSALDILAKPNVARWHQRGARPVLLHMATVTWLFILFALLWGRAWFAMVCTVGLLGLLIGVNNAKFKALREPVVFSDLALFAQSIKHPRLYFPYLSWLQLFAVVPAVAFLVSAFALESELKHIATGVIWLVWLTLLLFSIWLARGLKVTLNPERDQAEHGFFCVFVAYLLNGLSLREIRHVKKQFGASPYANISVKTSDKSGREITNAPDVVVVQSESFFDVRKIGLSVQPGLLKHFDDLKQAGICSGALAVPAWGANTMRTEHAFLSGLPNESLRYASFYPYAFVTKSMPAMAHVFQARGYRCTAVHPYPSDFFLRNKVFPRLGFDDFVDEVHFADAAHEGPYVSDQAVTDWLVKRLDQSAKEPQFLFAITMENHGPLHLEKATDAEADSLYIRPHGQSIDDLTVYLRHIANADKMLRQLHEYLASRQRNTLLCFYGDHVPAMGHVYDTLKVNPHNSEYLIWGNHAVVDRTATPLETQLLTPEKLGLRLAQIVGVI